MKVLLDYKRYQFGYKVFYHQKLIGFIRRVHKGWQYSSLLNIEGEVFKDLNDCKKNIEEI